MKSMTNDTDGWLSEMRTFLNVLGVLLLILLYCADIGIAFIPWIWEPEKEHTTSWHVKRVIRYSLASFLGLALLITLSLEWSNSVSSNHGSCQVGHYVQDGKTTQFYCDTYFPKSVIR